MLLGIVIQGSASNPYQSHLNYHRHQTGVNPNTSLDVTVESNKAESTGSGITMTENGITTAIDTAITRTSSTIDGITSEHVTAEGTEILSSNEESCPDSEVLANTKEKTPMCLVNELSRFNKVSHPATPF